MMNESIPMIDLKKISDQVERNKLREACEIWGCFGIINHSIPETLMVEMTMVSGSLLDLPMEIKMRNTDVSGYVAPKSFENPLFETLSIYDFASSELAVKNFCSQLNASPYQRKVIEAYGKEIHDLAVKIGQKMADTLAVEGVGFEDWPCQLRMNKYHFTSGTIGSIGVQQHTDSGFLTILQVDEYVGGLEVMDNSGLLVDVPPGTLLVLLGDVSRAWSNGRFCNVKHRVQCKEAAKRLSIATFMFAPRNGNVQAPEEVVSHDCPRLYRPFNYEDYRKLRFSKNMHVGEALELLRFS